jgi:mannose-6-phosphate isomerase
MKPSVLESSVRITSPLTFVPNSRPQVWGGRRLAALGKVLPADQPVGESWELSGVMPYISHVANGPWAGLSLIELWDRASKSLCRDRQAGDSFPWLIKWLDCNDWLSVQVHPDERRAEQWLGRPAPKSEVWVVVAAEPTARVFAGFREGVSAADVERHLTDRTLPELLHTFVPQPGDVIDLPAGTVHAAGGGLVLAEVQQPSDATFRLYDWDRLGSDGQPRELHLDAGMEAINWPQGPVNPVQPQAWESSRQPEGATAEQLVCTSFARLDRFRVSAAMSVESAGMCVWMVLAGAAGLHCPGEETLRLSAGETVLIPDCVPMATWKPESESVTLMRVSLPNISASR